MDDDRAHRSDMKGKPEAKCYPSVMGSAGVKQRIIETVQQLPDDATVEDAIERLYFLAKIERGLVQSEAGQGVAHDEIKKRFAK
jgi:hypothetical protein